MSEEEKGFIIRDRRQFRPGGEPGAESSEPEEPRPEPGPSAGEARETAGGPEEREGGQEGAPLPEATFSTLIFSLSTSALLHLGELPDPKTKETAQNLALAKQTIDILGLLQEKTRGNLDQEEESLLNNLLYELRMKYVAATRS